MASIDFIPSDSSRFLACEISHREPNRTPAQDPRELRLKNDPCSFELFYPNPTSQERDFIEEAFQKRAIERFGESDSLAAKKEDATWKTTYNLLFNNLLRDFAAQIATSREPY